MRFLSQSGKEYCEEYLYVLYINREERELNIFNITVSTEKKEEGRR